MTHKERKQVEEAFNRVNRAYGALFADQDNTWGEAMAELRFTKSTLARLLAPKPAVRKKP